ncbi:acyl-CoA dehydrogenase family protein [Amycolatopsis minnesotensis]|uniref:Acyl-CoA dehydrogenase family protein n=1 Tax=Amycolatopsis minnesotensis TaxID=337894 RepID=A0ABP5BJD5_9PSEU
MKFLLSEEQDRFAASVDDLLANREVDSATRAWARGEHDEGRKLWRALAEIGVTALGVPERYDGLGASDLDLVVAFDRLGYHAVPGPWTDTVAVLPALLDDELLAGVAAGDTLASVAFGPHVPYALDADIADTRVAVDGTALHIFRPASRLSSVDGARRLFRIEPGERIGEADPGRAFELGALTTAAYLLGAGQWLLDASVGHAKQRRQYGKPIGGFQAVKHLLADVVTGLELAKPLVHAAALTLAPRDVSAAKVAAGRAAHLAARTGLQVHGAIGYTGEHPLGLRLTKVRALRSAWGTPAFHRARVLESV